MKKLISIILLIIFILVCFYALSGCGSRKSTVNKTSSSSKETEKVKESSKIETETISQNKEQVIEQKDQTSENVTTVIEEEFANPEPGQPSKRKTTTTKGKSTDKGKINASKQSDLKESTNAQEELERAKEVQKNAKSKAKVVDADKTIVNNFGGPWVIFGISFIIVGAILAFYLIKRKRK